MKIIEIYLNIYYEKEMPNKIKYKDEEYKWNNNYKDYMQEDGLFLLRNLSPFNLKDEVEIWDM